MNIVYARNSFNKIDIRDNRPLAIERIDLRDVGFIVYLYDMLDDVTHSARYFDRASFDKEWILKDNIQETLYNGLIKYKDYKYED